MKCTANVQYQEMYGEGTAIGIKLLERVCGGKILIDLDWLSGTYLFRCSGCGKHHIPYAGTVSKIQKEINKYLDTIE